MTIFTDHQALITGYLSYLKDKSRGVLSRWYFKITQFLPNFTFKYKPGKINETAEDQEIRNIINFIEKKELPENTKKAQRVMNLAKKGYFVVDGILYFESSDVSD